MTPSPTPAEFSLLTDIALGIVFAAAASHVARLLRQPLILGYVLGGVLLGSHLGFGLVTDERSIELISEIGLIFLLFIIGLEINLRELAKMGKAALAVGGLQMAGGVALGGLFFGSLRSVFGVGSFEVLYLAVDAALSSTLIVVKLLHDKFELHTTSGRLTVGVLVLQDLAAILFLALQPNLSHPQLVQIASSLSLGLALVGVSFLVSRFLLSPLFSAAARLPELVLLTSIAWCFGLGAAAEHLGLSKEMGALIAGLSIAAFPYGADVISKLSGVRDFFVTLFFVSLGLKVAPPTAHTLGLSGLMILFVFASRLLTVAPTAAIMKQGLRNGLLVGINLSQISEFSLVILALGTGYGHVSSELSALVLTALLLASVVSTYAIQFNDKLVRGLLALLGVVGIRERSTHHPSEAQLLKEHRDIVLLGCYRIGQGFLSAVEKSAPSLKKRILVVDYDATQKDRLRARGFHWLYGDLANPETLRHIGIEQASLVICSISDTFLKGITNRRLLSHLKDLSPKAKIVMTADENEEADRMLKEGAGDVMVSGRLSGAYLFDLVTGKKPLA